MITITTTMILMAATIKVLVDSTFKPMPKLKTIYIPLIALGLGTILYPLFMATFTAEAFLAGFIVGGLSIGTHETAKNIQEVVKNLMG